MGVNVPLGVYIPGTSVIHRTPVLLKLAVLVAYVIVVALGAPLIVAVPLVALGYLCARIPVRIAAGQILPALPILVPLAAVQWWQASLAVALTTIIGLLATIAAAALMTLTTTVAELMDALERGLSPFARFGLPVETISLAISLTIRLIPLQLHSAQEILQARAARGASWSITAFGVPFIVRAIQRARKLAEALVARGVGD
ncbi:energy-coupling factor transporter transmembrane component T family protein [Corynebacterium tapiri]|uniref:Energy-coupling factor transporter transmembrane protein EcfT n=1 Tax=Corynebacterium tapiri TaxID=1448266 RepID=A0A5C4U5C8_9CORY|nr:energy-coupling factor transporter transmembrane protein EcfT [Corynebacterium tapiri]TNL99243.1 energy-coupling factor transporter transmembrane protein EcfT [Corynebacterium tapiri]